MACTPWYLDVWLLFLLNKVTELIYNRLMEEKQKKHFEYVDWLKKHFEYVDWLKNQPSVIEFAKHYITTYKVEKYFDTNNQESVEFIASLFAQAYTHEDGYKFNKETDFDKGFTISDIIDLTNSDTFDKTRLLGRTLSRIERALKYNDDGSVTVNLWKDLENKMLVEFCN